MLGEPDPKARSGTCAVTRCKHRLGEPEEPVVWETGVSSGANNRRARRLYISIICILLEKSPCVENPHTVCELCFHLI